MDCATIDIDNASPADFLRESIVTARQTHICTECRGAIITGEQYEYVCGFWDGEFYTFKTCQDCQSLRDVFFSSSWEYGWIRDEVRDYVSDCLGNIPEKLIADLTPVARGWVCGLIEDTWEGAE